MVLVHTGLYARIPYSDSADLVGISVSLDDQKVSGLKPYAIKFILSEMNTLDFLENESVPKHICHSEVWCF